MFARLITFGSTVDPPMRVTTPGPDEIDFCTPTGCGFTEGGRVIETDEVAEPGTVLFTTRWFTLNGEGGRRETADLGALGDAWSGLRTLTLALEFILAFGRTTWDSEGDLLGDDGRLETFGRDETPFALTGDGGRSLSSLTVTYEVG